MRGGFILASAPILLLACNALSGVGDLTADPDADEIGLPEGGRPEPDAGSPPEIAAPPPTCECAPAPPEGWSALSLLVTTTGGAPSGCPTGLVPTMTGGAEPKGGGCSPCTCGAVTGACTTAILQTAKDTCTNPCGGTGPFTVTSTCTKISYCDSKSAASAYMLPDAGSCPPSGGTFSPASFDKRVAACSFSTPPSGSCGSGEVCAPKSEGAPNAPVCIVKAGDVDCPSGSYSQKSVYYASLVDERTCSACSCGAPNVTCSPATISIYIGESCSNQQDQVTTAAGACATFGVPLPPGSAKITGASNVINNTGCAPSGGNAQGSLDEKEPTTVCCMPK